MFSYSCISTVYFVVSWRDLVPGKHRQKYWTVQSESSKGSATLRSFIDLVFTKHEATATSYMRISFFPADTEKIALRCVCWVGERPRAPLPLTPCLHAPVGVFHWHICSFFGAIFKRVGREDVVSALDFTLSSVCGVKFRYMEQAAEKKLILVKRQAE